MSEETSTCQCKGPNGMVVCSEQSATLMSMRGEKRTEAVETMRGGSHVVEGLLCQIREIGQEMESARKMVTENDLLQLSVYFFSDIDLITFDTRANYNEKQLVE